MATAYTLCTGPIAGAVGIGKGRVLVSVQGDGVSCYDISTQKPVASWALGGAEQEFSSAAVYDYATNQCYAPVRPRGSGTSGKAGSRVLVWSADDTVGSITHLAHALHLPALHSLIPISRTPEGEAEEKAAAEAEERAAMEVDGSGVKRAGAIAVATSATIALCSSAEVVAEAEEDRGQHTVAAAYQEGVLVLVHSDPRSGAVSSTVCRVQGGRLESEPALQLLPPSAGCRAMAAASTTERTAVLWSDGTVAVYLIPGDKRPLLGVPGQTGSSWQAVVQRRLAGYRLPAGKQKASGGSGAASSKKRGAAAAEAEVPAGGVSMAAIGDKQVTVVGWAADSEGTPVLRLVVLETTAACVQLAQDFTAADVGLAALDPSKPVQVTSLGPGSNQLAVGVGSAVLIATLNDLKPPTLANLLGALAIDKALIATRSSGSSSSSGGSSLLAVPAPSSSLLGGTVAVNPSALAAAQVLHADELAALSSPFGGAARPVDFQVELEDPTEPGQWLVQAKQMVWKVKDEAADQRIATEERRVWQEVQQPAAAALASDAALQQLLEPLLGLRRSTGLPLSPRLVCRLLMLAAEHKRWGAAAAILAAQPPSALGEVPGLAAAAADAGQFGVLEQLLSSCRDLPAAELAALAQVLLSPAGSDSTEQARQKRHKAAQAAAAGAATAAEHAVEAMDVEGMEQQPVAALQQQQQQQQQQQAEERVPSASKAGRRRRKRGGSAAAADEEAAPAGAAADDSDSEAEDLVAASGGPDVAPAQHQQQQQAAAAAAARQLPLPGPLARPGARQQAVAACCRAAVEGFEAADTCLHPLVALRLSPSTVREALRTLGALQAVQLLRYLLCLLRNHEAIVGGRAIGWQPPLQLPPGVALPGLQQVLNWAGATLDANLVKLSMQPEARPLLSELRQVVDQLVADTRPLLRLSGMLRHLLQAAQQQTRAAGRVADYSIQWLDLRVLPAEQQQPEQQQPQ